MNAFLECGHVADSTFEGRPCCAICFLITAAALVPAEAPDLTGRTARCGCGKTAPSSVTLPFFEYCGPGSRRANSICRNCKYSLPAHDPAFMQRNGPSNRQTVVERGECKGFDPHGAYDTDSYYCGCFGWD